VSKLKKMIRNRWFWVGAAAVLIVCIWIFARPEKQTAVRATRVITPQRGTITETVNVSGVFSYGTQVEIYPEVNGAITQLYVEKGDAVKKGQVIAKLDAKELLRSKQRAAADLAMSNSQLVQAEANLAMEKKDSAVSAQQARTNLANAEASLAKLKAGSKSQEIAQAEASLRQAKLNLDTAKHEEERQKLLYQNGAISRQQYEAAQKQVQLGQEDVFSAEQKLSLVKEGPSPSEMRAAEAQVAQARAALNGQTSAEQRVLKEEAVKTARASLTQAQLAYQKAVEDLGATVITSPIDGVVLDVPVKKGSLASSNSVSANTLIASIADSSMPKVEIYVNEADLSKVKVGQQAKIKIDALSRQWEGEVYRIDPKATEDSNVVTFAVDVIFERPPAGLKEGLTADVDLIVASKENVLWVPSFAIQSHGQRSVVTVKQGEKITSQTVRVGISDGTRTEIVSGLSEKSQVLMGVFRQDNDNAGSEGNSNSQRNNSGRPPGGRMRYGG
jgi:HlyD family secretion protein